MKILIDAVNAQYGGIRTYVDGLLKAWEADFDDDVHVLVPRDSDLDTRGFTRHEVGIGRPVAIRRPWVQTRELRRLSRQLHVDAVLATLPSTTLVKLGVPTAVVVYDLRHELRPEQFTVMHRIKRRLSYTRGYAIADGIIAISQRGLDDLHRLHPRTLSKPSQAVWLGGNHVLDWAAGSQEGPAVAFGHQTNKNPLLLLEAWALLRERGGDVPDLVITGISGQMRGQLETQVLSAGLENTVTLAPFLDTKDFQELFGKAGLIVFPSDFEGFGLPALEAMWLRKPLVISDEPALREVTNGLATIMRGSGPDALADAVVEASNTNAATVEAAHRHATAMTWSRTVNQTRALISQICEADR